MTDPLETLTTPEWERDPSALDALAVVGTVGAFWLLGGPLGAGLAITLGGALVVLPGVIVVALGQVALGVLLPEDPALALILLGEFPLVVLLGAGVDRTLSDRQLGAAVLSGGVVLAASVAVIVVAPNLWLAALAVLGVTALLLYGGHRYAIVRYETTDGSQVRNETGPGAEP